MAGKAKNHISEADHEAITAAIKTAETKTSGEIFAVVAHASDDYIYPAALMVALWTLAFGLLAAVGLEFYQFAVSPVWLALAQVLGFCAAFAVLRAVPTLRVALVPRSLAYRRASQNAVRQFLAHGIHTTEARSGVLLFVSLAEHYAEVVADEGIDQRVDQAEWDAMVATLVDAASRGDVVEGFLEAIGDAGKLLAAHFPPLPGERNELDDRLVEI